MANITATDLTTSIQAFNKINSPHVFIVLKYLYNLRELVNNNAAGQKYVSETNSSAILAKMRLPSAVPTIVQCTTPARATLSATADIFMLTIAPNGAATVYILDADEAPDATNVIYYGQYVAGANMIPTQIGPFKGVLYTVGTATACIAVNKLL